eukprot:261872-Chlamydomonas_euryale.AAC.1
MRGVTPHQCACWSPLTYARCYPTPVYMLVPTYLCGMTPDAGMPAALPAGALAATNNGRRLASLLCGWHS